MRLALFGGSFDPIHHGHLILARDAIEQLDLDRVIFIPAAISPHKLHTSPALGEVRCAMVAAAIAGEPRFELDASELSRSGPSFTIHTVEATRARLPEARLFYLIGHDNLAKLHTWHRIEDLRRLVEFVVFGRGENESSHPFHSLQRRLDLSATEIRARVARGASIRYLVPETVSHLIEQHRLYLRTPEHAGTHQSAVDLAGA
jgi:nicotinate-nucleotide adenylyltransferase